MKKTFLTERDIEDLAARGVHSLELNDDIVLTELAYEKANRLGVQLMRGGPATPPAAPVRPYIAQSTQGSSAPSASPAAAGAPTAADLQGSIREAVKARLGTQIDPILLDTIIRRVLNNVGVK
jgi:hypothetical protein